MNKKILKINNKKGYYSYKEIYSYKNKEILKPVNNSIEYGNNVVYCMCNGKDIKRHIKMYTRKSENGSYYSLTTSSKNSLKHNLKCPKHNEFKVKKELIAKGRVYDSFGMSLELDINKNNYSANINEKYSKLYGVGELLLTVANNSYIDKNNKIGKEDAVLSYLYRYYEKGDSQSIETYLNDLIISSASNIKLGQVIFNPKWLKCDTTENKTSTVVRSYIELNKRYKNDSGPVLQYLLLKYIGYTIEDDDKVKIELYSKGKNTKENYDKKIFIYMDKFDFFNRFNMDKVEDINHKAEYYISSLVYAYKGKLFVQDAAFIPVYPGYCIPVDTVNEIKLLSEILKYRNRLTIKKVAKMSESLEFRGAIPDFIISVDGLDTPIFLEFFDYILPEYYEETLSKTRKYEQLSKEGKCNFLGFYNNLDWKAPSIEVILYPNFKTMDNLGVKVENSISKILKSSTKS